MVDEIFIDLTRKDVSMNTLVDKLNTFFKKNLNIPLTLGLELNEELAKDAACEIMRLGL